MRAVLLANATVTSMRGLRSSIRASQDPAGAPLMQAWRTTALPPMMSKRRIVRSPIFEVAPSRCLPPVDFCNGVRPSQAAKSRPDLNVSAAGASATIAVAVIGPTPGIVIKRRATGSSLDRRPISTSRTAMFSSRDFRFEIKTLKMVRALGKLAVWVLNLVDQGRHMCGSFGNHPAIFRQVSPQRIDALRALAHQHVSSSKHNAARLLLFVLDRHEAHVRPLSRLADRRGIGRGVLLSLHERLDIGRRYQPHRMAQLGDLSPPMMCAAASFQGHKAPWLRSEELD